MRRALAALVAVVALALAVPAGADGVRIREATLAPDGATRLVVSAPGVSRASFTVTEDGREVDGLDVQPLVGSGVRALSVVIAIDTSGSTAGTALAEAKRAASAFVDQLPAVVQVAVVGFGPVASVVQPFTTDRAALHRAVGGLVAGGETALYDAVTLAASTAGHLDAQRNVVVFSDGGDTVSRAGLDDAVAAADAADAPVTTVVLRTPDVDEVPLRSLAARTSGAFVALDDPAQLVAAFEAAAGEVASQYVLSYDAARTGGDQLRLSVATHGRTDEVVVSNPRTSAPRPASTGAVGGAFLWMGLTLAAVAIALLATLLMPTASSRGERRLRDALRFYEHGPARSGERRLVLDLDGVKAAALQALDRVPKPDGYEDRLQVRLERAGWPLRAGEFSAIRVAAAVGAVVVVGVLASPVAGTLLAVVAWFVPSLVLDRRVAQRRRAFLAQLPDTLQLLAASLEAGYGLLQAIDTIVKEASPPTSEEFARAMSEIRLGMPPGDALDALAERLDVDDFTWVVMAMNIQREVGGNLATLLRTVADTLREREQVRRGIKVLSAEGRLSAVILTVLPFGLAAWMAIVNPAYLSTLTSSGVGKALVVASLALMGAGTLWLRKLIRIEV